MKRNIFIFSMIMLFWSCATSTQKGRAVGFITDLTHDGVFWKSWDMELNSSQTGMTSTSHEAILSIDRDNEDVNLVNQLDSAQKYGWKVQIDYECTFGTNCFENRGSSCFFIKKVEVLDRTPLGGIKSGNFDGQSNSGKVVDTIYVIIQPKKQ